MSANGRDLITARGIVYEVLDRLPDGAAGRDQLHEAVQLIGRAHRLLEQEGRA